MVAASSEDAKPAAQYRRSVQSYRIPDVTVVAADGAKVALASETDAGMPVLVNFIFTSCPSVCPVQSATFAEFQKKLGPEIEKIRMISISIDPEYDTPERLNEYAKRYQAAPQWRFLTGNLQDIVTVQKAFNAYRGDKMSHEPLTLLRASPDDSWRRLDGFVQAAVLLDEYRRTMKP